MKNIPIFLEKGISVTALFDSDIFNMNFDYDEWPGAHTNDESILRPYNESLFQIRKHYRTVFPEDEFKTLQEQKEENEGEEIDVDKVFKIKYSINILPGVGEYIIDSDPENGGCKTLVNTDANLLGLISGTEELSIFETKTI